MSSARRQRWSCISIVMSLGVLTSCAAPSFNQASSPALSPEAASSNVKVVVTSTVLCDMTQQIAANTVNLTCLLKPGTDPHVYEVSPNDRKAIGTANLILYSGYNFEPSLIKLIQSTSNTAPKVAIAQAAVPTPQQFDQDGKTVPDPHVWHNAQNGVKMIAQIEQNLSKAVPANAALYAKNAQTLTAQVTEIDGWIRSTIATIPQPSRKLVTTHDALGYYSKAYNIPVEGALQGISTDEKPTANRVKDLVKTIQDTKVPTIFAETAINPDLIQTVARESNVKISDREIFADGLGEPGSEGDTYAKMLVANTKTIVEGLGGKFTPFALK